MKRRIPLLLLAFVLAVAGVAAVGAYARSADARALAGQRTRVALVANADIKAGTSSTQVKSAVTTKQLPASATPDGALSDLAGVDGKVTATAVVPGQVLVASMFVVAQDQGPVPLVIPDGQMAVSIPLQDPMHVADFVVPGTEVAVFDTFNAREGDKAGAKTPSGDGISDKFEYDRSTRLLLPRVRVLAIGSAKVGDKPTTQDSQSSGGAVSVTLAVSQADAERLILSSETGRLYLALLNHGSKTAPSGGVDNRKLFG